MIASTLGTLASCYGRQHGPSGYTWLASETSCAIEASSCIPAFGRIDSLMERGMALLAKRYPNSCGSCTLYVPSLRSSPSSTFVASPMPPPASSTQCCRHLCFLLSNMEPSLEETTVVRLKVTGPALSFTFFKVFENLWDASIESRIGACVTQSRSKFFEWGLGHT